MHKKWFFYCLLVLVIIIGFILLRPLKLEAPSVNKQEKTPTTGNNKERSQSASSFNKQQYSLSESSSIWVVVNKQRPLNPKSYVPANLVVPKIPLRGNITGTESYVRSDMAPHLEQLVADASKDGVQLNLQSGYRSYNFQVTLYNGYVSRQGQAVADTQSARPGYSEHQTGLAADLGSVTNNDCNVEQCFGTIPEGKWLAAKSYKYGFIIRYTETKQSIAGYEYEPWHIRYVGVDLATEMHTQGIETLEEFFKLPAAPDYN